MRSVFLGGLFTLGCSSSAAEPPAAPQPVVSEQEVAAPVEKAPEGPRLVLWLTVDQMRGDYLEKYKKHFDGDGFNRILKSGTHFTNAHYAHAITETAPGHATLFTGTSPNVHGIIGNSWLLADGSETASVDDPSVHAIGPGVGPEDGGRSPLHLFTMTVGDELVRQTHGKGKVIAVSSKDRAAILPAGKVGSAYWLGTNGFITSTDYGEKAPGWLSHLHEEDPPSDYLKAGWPLLLEEDEYQNPAGTSDWTPAEWTKKFPHQVKKDASPVKALIASSFGDEAVIDAALAAIDGESLGKDEVTDLLSVSLSSTDLIGHLYGPESREMEDQLVRLDRQLARLFGELDKRVPREEVLIVLAADHGGCESAAHSQKVGRKGRRLREEDIAKEVRAVLKKKFPQAEFLLGVESPYVFLKRDLIQEKGLDLAEVRKTVAEAVEKMPGVHSAHPLNALGGDPELKAKLVEAIHPEISGDIYVVPEKRTLFLQRDTIKATHGSPWDYDSHVPILIAGDGVKPGKNDAPVDVRSLAPTVASLIDIEPPPRARQPVLPLTVD